MDEVVNEQEPSTVTHDCNPNLWESGQEDREFQASPRKI